MRFCLKVMSNVTFIFQNCYFFALNYVIFAFLHLKICVICRFFRRFAPKLNKKNVVK